MKFVRIAIVLAVLALMPIGVARMQELPPGPTTEEPLRRQAIENVEPGFDEAQMLVLDFAPGSWTPLHSHGGLTLVRVLEGEMTRNVHGVIDVFGPGEGWIEEAGDIHAAGNDGDEPARVLVTFLLPSGAPLTVVEGTPSASAPPGPTASAQSQRVSVSAQEGAFDEAATTTLAFAPGAWTPQHTHGGLTLVDVIEGDMTVRSDAGEVVYHPGDLWIEQPGNVHAAGNTGESDARVAVTFLLDRGAPVTPLAAVPAPTAQD